MAITLDGVKVTQAVIGRDEQTGMPPIQGEYALMSSTGIVLAKQSFNGYASIKLTMTAKTQQMLQDFMEAIRVELNTAIGLG